MRVPLLAALEVAVTIGVLAGLFTLGEVTIGNKPTLAIVGVGFIPLAVVQIWVLFLLIRAHLRHPEITRIRDNLRNYIYKGASFIIFAMVALDGIVDFLPGRLTGGVLLVAGIYVLAAPGIVEVVRYYRSNDGDS